ncbi:Pls/PosA family non-ribosomal peptide synthetase [Amycolatopsis sp. DSM 110486]|uniref:Pls/PosA family non-ribosomal peptide synthetase n=1 Tax=Amycolatopsis sp. DSM 110486 TaxID=2865832 RepID=UPI0021050EBD|nr:Pls/PosA family non-ribosomal peptide synthetase [Amycolatopsis sp. DSM 110486]
MGNSHGVLTAEPADNLTTLAECERVFAEVLADIVGADHVPVDSHFFDDLGADSMVMARFCARVRKRPDLPSVSMPDVYKHPTIRSLAAALTSTTTDTATTPASQPATTLAECEQLFAEVLADIMGTDHVPVDSHFFDDLGADSMVMARFCARVRKRPDLPSVSMPDVYKHPTIRSLAAALTSTTTDTATTPASQPATTPAECEQLFAEVLADIMGTDHVPVDSHFFDDLGADSMVMARFCARIRKRPDLPSVSMPDTYKHPTIRSLAAALTTTTDTETAASQPATPAAPNEPPRHARNGKYVLCGTLQLLFLLGYPGLTAAVWVAGFKWVSASPNLVDVYLRSVAFGAAMFLGLCTLPILVKWVFVGRWKPQEIRVWSMAYVRFWLVKTLIQRNPMILFVGSPLYALYLRALGAEIGRGAVIFSRNLPACTDLLSIGDGAVIRKDSFFNGYRAHDGVIQTGAVSIGKDALVGEATVLDIRTSLGDGAQLGHSSALHAGQAIPAGERWVGAPAQRAEKTNQMAVSARDVGTGRRVVFSAVQLGNLLLLGLPLTFGIADFAIPQLPEFGPLLDSAPVSLTTWTFFRDALVVSAVVFFGAVLVGLVLVGTVPRVLNLFIKPDKVYPLYGFRYWVHRAIARTTNIRLFTTLFGGTSYIIYYLRWLGYSLRGVRQTGSNFGEMVKHDTPFLSAAGSGTMVADGLSIINADFSSTSFRLSHASIGPDNFLGNMIAYPPQSKAGENCLLATKVMVPLDGQVREGVGLLGAPSFEIPRSVKRDRQLDVTSADELRRGLRAKTIYNTISMALFLLVRWTFVLSLTVVYLAAINLLHFLGSLALAVALATAVVIVFTVAYNVLVDRLFRPLQALVPQGCSIYDRTFWRHERFWKVSSLTYVLAFNGTPLKNVIWRLLGMRVGRRVFDDGLRVPERSFTTIGENCTLNADTIVQCHSQEDGGFKSDRIAIGAGCTLGVGAFVHYGVTTGDRAVLATSSFLMKGEEMPPNALWGGNPATEMREHSVDLQVRKISIDDNGAAVLVRGG